MEELKKKQEEIKEMLKDYDLEVVLNAFSGVLAGMEMAGENLYNFFQVMKYEQSNMVIRTSVDLKQMDKVAKSKEYEDLFLELDKIKNKLKTGQDIADEIQKRTNLPRDESLKLMTSYLLRGEK